MNGGKEIKFYAYKWEEKIYEEKTWDTISYGDAVGNFIYYSLRWYGIKWSTTAISCHVVLYWRSSKDGLWKEYNTNTLLYGAKKWDDF